MPFTSLGRSDSAPSPQHFLKKSIRVGSIHTQLSYDRVAEAALHRSEMPAPARAARAAKAAMRAADAVRWKSETSTFRVPERRSMENFAHDPTEYTYNARAEVLPKSRPVLIDAFGTIKKVFFDNHFNRELEMPVHGALADKARWDLSTQWSFAERARVGADKDASHRAAAAQATARLTGAMAASGGGAYLGPKAREDRRCAESRAAKAADAEAAAPQLSDDARAATLRWTASFRDAAARHEPLSPAASQDSLATASQVLSSASAAEGSSSITGGGGGGGGGGARKPPTNLEVRYAQRVKEEIEGTKTSALGGAAKSTRWCYGSL